MHDNSELLDAALRYAELGYPVFPCAPRGKKPITAQGFIDATSDPHIIRQWWANHPSANIAIPTAGLLVVDVDAADAAWPGDPERAAQLASAGAMATTPRGGRHYWYRRPPGKSWRCTQSKLAEKIDTRTDGGYILVAPSVTTHGAYAWLPGLELEQAPTQLPPPPDWLSAQLDALGKDARSAPAAANGSSEVIPEGRRNATLAQLAGTMRRAGFSQKEITAALTQVNRDRCVPPMEQNEVDQVAASIARYQPHAAAVAGVAKPNRSGVDESLSCDANRRDPGPIPQALLHVPGFIGAVMQFTLDSAPYPEPALAFAGALSLQGFLAGRKVRDAMNNRTGLYIVGLANSGTGKDFARKVNANVMIAAGLADGLGTSIASGEGIEDRLLMQPASLFQIDELDGLLLRVSQARDGRHEQIMGLLLQMYTTDSSTYVMRAKAGQQRSVIDQPSLSLFGTAVPKHFYESLSARLMTNGFLARLIILESGPRGQGRDEADLEIPSAIIDTARWWAEFRPKNWDDKHPTPRSVPHDSGALAMFRDLRLQANGEYAAAEKIDDQAGMAIWARVCEKTRRLALNYACSACHEAPTIDRSAAEWSAAFVLHQTQRMLFMAGRHACESVFDAKRKRVLQALEHWRTQHGTRWMPYWQLSRAVPWPRQDHDEVRDALFEQRLIDVKQINKGSRGRPGFSYRMAISGTNAGEQP